MMQRRLKNNGNVEEVKGDEELRFGKVCVCVWGGYKVSKVRSYGSQSLKGFQNDVKVS